MAQTGTAVHTEAQLFETAGELMAIESTANNPDGLWAAHDLMAQFLQSADVPGLTIEKLESNGVPSLLAYVGQQRPDKFLTLLNGHLDVVAGPQPFKLQIKGNTLTGRGAVDMKIAAVVLSSLLLEFGPQFAELENEDGKPTALGLQLVTDEETGGYNGAMYQIKEQGVRADLVICAECGRHPGQYDVANLTKGPARANLAFESTDPLDPAANKALRYVVAMQEAYPGTAERADDTTITCGQAISHEPDHDHQYLPGPTRATLKIDARYVLGDPDFASQELFAELLGRIGEKANGPGQLTITDIPMFDLPMYTDQNHPQLQLLRTAAETIENRPFSFAQRAGTGDGRHYSRVGVAACEFGIVGTGEHTPQEVVTKQAVRTYIATMRLFLKSLLEEKRAARTAAA